MAQIATFWKPLTAATIFTCGVFVVAWTGTIKPERSFGWFAASFCMLCIANLVLISRREQGTASGSAAQFAHTDALLLLRY